MIAKTSTAPVIQLKGLTKRYGIGDTARDVLDSVNLKIEQGEFIAVMGPSGCGKTTYSKDFYKILLDEGFFV